MMARPYEYPPWSGEAHTRGRLLLFGVLLPEHIHGADVVLDKETFSNKIVWLTSDGRRFEHEVEFPMTQETMNALLVAMELSR